MNVPTPSYCSTDQSAAKMKPAFGGKKVHKGDDDDEPPPLIDIEMTDGPNVHGTHSRGAAKTAKTAGNAVKMDDEKATMTAAALRARRRHLRGGGRFTKDDVREDQGCDFDAPDRNSVSDFGYVIEPFNMRRENTEGHFDDNGMYIEHKEDLKKLRDAWLDTVDEGLDTAKILPQHVKKLSPEQIKLMGSKLVYEKITNDDDDDKPVDEAPAVQIDTHPFVYELCMYLAPSETPCQAMRRLKKGAQAYGKFSIRKRRNAKNNNDAVSAHSATTASSAKPSTSTAVSTKKRLTEWGYDDQPAAKRKNDEPDVKEIKASEASTSVPAGLPAERENAPAESESVLAESESVPAERESVQAESESVPGERENVPAERESVPAEKESVPAESESVPAERESVPAERESVPAERENVVSATRNGVHAGDEKGSDKGNDTDQHEAATRANDASNDVTAVKTLAAATPLGAAAVDEDDIFNLAPNRNASSEGNDAATKKEDNRPPAEDDDDFVSGLLDSVNNISNDAKKEDSVAPAKDDDSVSGLLDSVSSETATTKAEKQQEITDGMTSTAKTALERVSELCDTLLQQGMYDVYSTSREDFVTSLFANPAAQAQNTTTSQAASASQEGVALTGDGPFWQYKLPDAEQSYGPFDSRTMLFWHPHFVGKKLQVRAVSATGEPVEEIWREYEAIDFALPTNPKS